MPEYPHLTLLMFVAMFWCICCFIRMASHIVYKKQEKCTCVYALIRRLIDDQTAHVPELPGAAQVS
jgi:hypothetical protein